MKPVPNLQTSPLRAPNKLEQTRFEKEGQTIFLFVALIPLLFLIPIIATPNDPEVPKFIAMMVAMELGIVALFRISNSWHRSDKIYFNARCTSCYRMLAWRLGSAKSGLDKRGVMRCRCGALHRYERVNYQMVHIRPQATDGWLRRALSSTIPLAWDADQ
jgi:hypothetical protein